MEISGILPFGVDIADPIFKNSVIFVKHMGRYGYGGPPGPIPFGLTSGSLSGSLLAPFWAHFRLPFGLIPGSLLGSLLAPFRAHVWHPFGVIPGPLLGSLLAPFWVTFGTGLGLHLGAFWRAGIGRWPKTV